MGAQFAVKLVALAEDESAAARQRLAFDQEAAALQRLHHPNIVRYMLHGEAPDATLGGGRGALVIVMEYVDGPTLKDLIVPEGLPREQAGDLVTQLCRGLNAIHTAQPPLVHRDIKPANLVVGARDEGLRIVDFGLGRDSAAPIKAESAAAGTPRYMAPEQLKGGHLDARTDLYAAALVGYELLTGRVPLCDAAGMPDARARAAGWRPGPDEAVAGFGFDTFFTRALAAAPEKRFADAEGLLRAFEACVPVPRRPKPSKPKGQLVPPTLEPIVRANRWEDYRDGCIDAIGIEIEAVKADLKARGADQPVEVRNGIRVDRAPDWSLYTVRSPKDLVIAEDTPLRATLEGQGVRGHVVACDPDDGTMQLAFYEDAGSEFARAMVQFDATFILERLREHLECSTRDTHTALALALAKNGGRVGDAALDDVAGLSDLNAAQADAVRRALGSSVTYVWGPPGTGKTRTIGHLLASLLAMPGRAAALAPTNVAADTMLLAVSRVRAKSVRAAIESGRIIRLGETSAEIRRQRLHLEWAFECTAREAYPVVAASIEGLFSDYLKLFGRRKAEERNAADEDLLLRGKYFRIRRDVARELQRGRHQHAIDEAALTRLSQRVVALLPEIDAAESAALARATLIVSTLSKFHLDRRLEPQTFTSVIVDEVSMALFPALLHAACQARQRVVVAGDFRQLPPVVISDNPQARRWLGHDIFEHAGISDADAEVPARPLLEMQYRMHPEISRIVSDLFYGGRLVDADEILARHPSYRTGSASSDRTALALFDTSPTSRSERPQDRSRQNAVHAELVADTVQHAAAAGQRDIAVITPYVAQARLIRDCVLKRGPQLLTTCRISTVHRFQGQEAPLVILDTVDAPDVPSGFLHERKNPQSVRIINVAISRAQERLLVIAHSAFLARQMSPKTKLLRLLAEIRLRGREFTLGLGGEAGVRSWLSASPSRDGQNSDAVAAEEWVRWQGREGFVLAVEGSSLTVLSGGQQVEVSLEKIEEVFRNERWVRIAQ